MSYTEQEQAILIKLGNAIREARKAKGWSQEELAFQAAKSPEFQKYSIFQYRIFSPKHLFIK